MLPRKLGFDLGDRGWAFLRKPAHPVSQSSGLRIILALLVLSSVFSSAQTESPSVTGIASLFFSQKTGCSEAGTAFVRLGISDANKIDNDNRFRIGCSFNGKSAFVRGGKISDADPCFCVSRRPFSSVGN